MSLRSIAAALVGLSLLTLGVRPLASAQAQGQLTRPPRLVQFVEAPYPEAELASERDATVVLAIVIAADGTVEDVTVQESAGEAFDAAAVEAARQFVFEPAEIDGTPSRIRILYGYQFAFRPAEPEAPTTAVYEGVIRDHEGAPLAGVTVTLDDGGPTATTDAEGHFVFESVEPGTHTVTLTGEHLAALQTQETFAAGERLEAQYDVALTPETPEGEQDDMEIVVMAPTIQRQVLSTQVEAAEARRAPGTQGDVLRVVENLPGVARSAVGSGQLVVWGAAPGDTRVYVDGVRIPSLYHVGGFRSVIAPELVQSVDLAPGGYGAAYGRGLGGLVTIQSALPRADRVHASIGANTYDGSAMVSVPTASGWRFAAAGRGSWLRPLANTVMGSNASYAPIPSYWDGQLRAVKDLRAGETVEVAYIMGGDRVSRGVPNNDPALVIRNHQTVDYHRIYARWQRDYGNGAVATVVPWAGWERQSNANSFGSTTTSISRSTYLVGLRANYRVRLEQWVDAEAGVSAEADFSSLQRIGSIGLPPREGDIRVFGQPPPDQIAADNYGVKNISVAPYVQTDLHTADGRLHVIPGLRVDPFLRIASRTLPVQGTQPSIALALQSFAVDPRLAISYSVTERVGLRAAGGLYHQAPAPEDMSASFGNPALPISKAEHALLGATVRPIDELSIEATAFTTFSQHLAMRNTSPTPPAAQVLLPTGAGRTFGGQLLLRLSPMHGFSGWISYTCMRSERRNAPGTGWRLSDYDQTNVFTALTSWSPGKGWDIGLRFRYATGMPRTQVIGAYYDTQRDLWQPLFGPHQGIRLPAFMQLDVRIAKTFDIGETKLNVYLDVQNVTNRVNGEEYAYSSDYTQRGLIRSFPILPVLGIQWTL